MKITFLEMLGIFFKDYRHSYGIAPIIVGIVIVSMLWDESDAHHFQLLLNQNSVCQGEVVSVEDVSFNNEEGEFINQKHYDFQYKVAEKTYTKETILEDRDYSKGQTIEVEYLTKDPSIATIANEKHVHVNMSTILFAAMLILLGFGIILWLLKEAIQKISIIHNGKLGTGKLVSSEISYESNHHTTHELKFRYEVEGKDYICKIKTREPEVLEDEEFEWLIYDQHHPARSVLVDTLPPTIRKRFEAEAQTFPTN
ncbi:DUF3592 domain-containing protein [Limibacter armeniacum]|uniref:DUF3592 domain-containing protein n=1 Tax=Limibacter armeniacum TaxID=466084 RepID=UPI002FE53EED